MTVESGKVENGKAENVTPENDTAVKPTKKRKFRPIERLFLLDVFFDQRARPVLIYEVLMITVAATLYHFLEGWNWLDSVYFVVITVTTIGYGDFTPTTQLTKLLTIFVALNGVVVLLTLFDTIRRVRGLDSGDETKESNQE